MITDMEKQNLIVGFKQVKKAITKGECKKIFLADDCSYSLSEDIKNLAGNIEVVIVPTMRELGTMCGIDVSASCACVKGL